MLASGHLYPPTGDSGLDFTSNLRWATVARTRGRRSTVDTRDLLDAFEIYDLSIGLLTVVIAPKKQNQTAGTLGNRFHAHEQTAAGVWCGER